MNIQMWNVDCGIYERPYNMWYTLRKVESSARFASARLGGERAALADLLPEVQFHSHDRFKLTASFTVGLLIALALGVLEPHYHH